jgi:hypothetical protein
MKKALKILGTILIIYIVVFSCNKLISSKLEEDINNSLAMENIRAKMEMKSVAEMMTKKLPQAVDLNTTAIKVEYLENENTLVFYYEVVNVTKEDFETKISSLKTNQIEFIKNNPNNSAYLKAEVTFKYIYSDSNATELGSCTILPNEYM